MAFSEKTEFKKSRETVPVKKQIQVHAVDESTLCTQFINFSVPLYLPLNHN